jgi:hypothetical protein
MEVARIFFFELSIKYGLFCVKTEVVPFRTTVYVLSSQKPHIWHFANGK